MATPEELREQFLENLMQRGASTRDESVTARTGGMESLQQAMTAGQPTAQDAWTTVVAGALPAILGGIFGGGRGLEAGAAGGLLGAKTNMSLTEAERERREKALNLKGSAQINEATLKEKEAGDFETTRARLGIGAAQRDIDNAQRLKEIGIQEAGANNRLAMQLAAKAAGGEGDKTVHAPLPYKDHVKVVGTEVGKVKTLFKEDSQLQAVQKVQKKVNTLMEVLQSESGALKGATVIALAPYLTDQNRVAWQAEKQLLPEQIANDIAKLENYFLNHTNQVITPDVKKEVAKLVVTLNNRNAQMIKENLSSKAQLAYAQSPYSREFAADDLQRGFDGAAAAATSGFVVDPRFYKFAGVPIESNALYSPKKKGKALPAFKELYVPDSVPDEAPATPGAKVTPAFSLEEIRAEKARRAGGANGS